MDAPSQVEASSHGEMLCAVGIASNTRGQDRAARLALSVALPTLEGHGICMRVLGVGSNRKKTERATRLACAATAAAAWAVFAHLPDPAQDSAFATVTRRVRNATAAASIAQQLCPKV